MSAGDEWQARLAAVRSAQAARRRPTRYDARELLLALGTRGLAAEDTGADDGLAAAAAELRAVVSPWDQDWLGAVREEMSLAAAEHVHSVDPRFLDHPRYDLEYTVAARERLEARLVACRLLEIELEESLLERIAAADGLLAERLGPADDPSAGTGR